MPTDLIKDELQMQRGRAPSHGDDGQRVPGGGGGVVGLLPSGPSDQLPSVQSVEEVSFGALRRHRLFTDGHSPTPRLRVAARRPGPRALQQREDHHLVPRLQHRLRQNFLFRITLLDEL